MSANDDANVTKKLAPESRITRELEMLFSRTAVQGIYALCYLNRAKSGTSFSSPKVASALGIPRDQAAKVMQSLRNAGLVRSSRGRRGGYAPMKRLDEISMIEVLDALNPPEDDERLRPKSCKRDPAHMCGAHRGLIRLNDCVRQALAGETLAGIDGTVCSDLEQPNSESGVALALVTQGDSSP